MEEKSVEEKSVESQDQKTLNHLCKVSHHTIPMLVKLASKGRSDAIREAAFHTLSCLLHMASKTVLTKFFHDHKIVSSPSNVFARALCSCLLAYSENFPLRDDIVLRGRHDFSKAKAVSEHAEPSAENLAQETSNRFSAASSARPKSEASSAPAKSEASKKSKSKNQDESQIEHDFLVKLLSIHDAMGKKEKLDNAAYNAAAHIEEIVTDVATEFEESGYTLCMAALKVISQLCVIESNISRVPFKEGQEFMVRD